MQRLVFDHCRRFKLPSHQAVQPRKSRVLSEGMKKDWESSCRQAVGKV